MFGDDAWTDYSLGREKVVRIFIGPREVAVHDKAIATVKQRHTLAEHRPPRGKKTIGVLEGGVTQPEPSDETT